MTRDARQYSARDLVWPLFALVVLFIMVLTAGLAASLVASGVWALFSTPGWVLFRRCRLTNPVNAVLASVVGVACSLTAVAAIGSLLDSFSPILIVAVPLLLGAVAWRFSVPASALVSRGANTSAVIPPLVALSLALPSLFPVGLPFGDTLQYRAFFNADFFKHTAHVESIARAGLPPEDAFAAGHRLAYYWIQYLVPGAAVRLSGSAITGDRAVLATGVFQTAVLGIVLFAAARRVTRRPGMAALACTLALLSLSLDGLAQQLRHLPYSPMLRMMVMNQSPHDITFLFGAQSAIAAVGFLRLNLYTPHHQLAIVLLAAWVALLPRRGARAFGIADASRLALILPLPGISLMTGGVAALVMAAGEWVRGRRRARIAAAGAMVGAFALCFATGMLDPVAASGDPFLRFLTRSRPPLWERLAWGPVQILTGFGVTALLSAAVLWRFRRFRSPVGLAILLPLAILFLAELLPDGRRLTREAQYKTSYVLNFGFLLGTALWLELRCWRRSVPVLVSAIALAIAGLVSPVHDVIWFSTLTPRWTTAIPREDFATLRWIRGSTVPTLVFQQPLEKPTILRGRDAWVPIFGGRAVRLAPRSPWAADAALERASRLLETTVPAAERLALARELRVDALFVSRALEPLGFEGLTASLERSGWTPLRRTPNTGVWLRPDLEPRDALTARE